MHETLITLLMEIARIFRMSWMKYLLKLCFLLPLEKWLNINWFSKGILSLNFFNAARNFLCSYLWWNSSICVLNLFLRKLLHQNFFLWLQSHLKICLMEHLIFFVISGYKKKLFHAIDLCKWIRTFTFCISWRHSYVKKSH